MAHTNEKGHGCDPVPFQKHTFNSCDFVTIGNEGKVLANQKAHLALVGHVLHTGQHGDSTVLQMRHAQYCKDSAELQTFAVKLGGNRD